MTRITHFMRRPRRDSFSIERVYADVRAHLPQDCQVVVHTCRNFSKGVWGRAHDAWIARSSQGEVNHVTGDVHYLTFFLDKRRTILTIHDLALLGRLKTIRRSLVWLIWYWFPVRRAGAVVVISESTRQQLLRHVRCDPAKLHVIHNNVSAEFKPSSKPFNAARPRILQIGTGWNKNLERVAEALMGIPCQLVVVGALSSQQAEILRRYKIDYECHEGLSREALVEQYVACDLVVFASLYEGFGLPIVEANTVGRPVLTSSLSSMPEVAADAAYLVDPFDVGHIRKGIQRIIGDPDYRGRLVQAGYVNARRFRAEVIAERYAQLYRAMALQ